MAAHQDIPRRGDSGWKPPFDDDAEASILGGILLRPKVLAELDDLTVDDFYALKHRVVFSAIRELEAASRPIDVVTLETEIQRAEKLDAIGGVGFLGELALRVPTPDNVVAYKATVKQHAINRRVAVGLASVAERAKSWAHDGSELLDEIIGDLERLRFTARAKPRRLGRTWDDCVAEIYARMHEPWVDVRIGSTVIAECRNGSFVPLVAPSGSGKSTLALQMLIDHAIHRGPALYLTYELDGDEAVGRGIGQLCSFGWASVLRGEVPRGIVPDVKRLRVLERDDATLTNLSRAVDALRAEFPNQPVFVVVDYLQATPAPPGKERGHTANVSVELRRAAKQNRVVLVGVSQASTDNSKKMRSGDLLGIDGAATGAETSQIERDAYVILTLGDRQPVDHDTVSWKLSVAKYRLGNADVVYELHYRGRIGAWTVVGEPRSATEVRDTRTNEIKAKKAAELRRAIVAWVKEQPKPVSVKQIIEVSTGSDRSIANVTKELIRDGQLAHVHGVRRGGVALIWTPEKIAEGAPS